MPVYEIEYRLTKDLPPIVHRAYLIANSKPHAAAMLRQVFPEASIVDTTKRQDIDPSEFDVRDNWICPKTSNDPRYGAPGPFRIPFKT